MKPKFTDYIIIAVIIIITAFSAFIFWSGNDGKKVVIKKDNKAFKTFDLNQDGVYKIETEYGENTLVIISGTAYFKDSNCPDKTCEKMGKIKNTGDSIVCLPHRIVAEVEE